MNLAQSAAETAEIALLREEAGQLLEEKNMLEVEAESARLGVTAVREALDGEREARKVLDAQVAMLLKAKLQLEEEAIEARAVSRVAAEELRCQAGQQLQVCVCVCVCVYE